MPRRRRSRDDGGALSSLEQTANAIYSSELPPEFAELDSRRKPARPINIFEIYPDHSQPRRAIPSLVREHWDGDPQTVPALFEAWVDEIAQVAMADFDLKRHLEQSYLPENVDGNDDEAVDTVDEEQPPALKSLLGLIELAASIRQTGLTNPITVARDGPVYHLETGERRWLAYHLLNIFDPPGDWTKIPAHLVDHVSVWRQASENNARTDLNAIGKARQLSILLMELLREQGHEFFSYDEIISAGQPEQEYYAQVADGDKFRVPRGEGERLLNATGLKNPTQIRQYRKLLRLPDRIWRRADDEDWPESKLRKFYTVTTVTVSRSKDKEKSVNPFVERINKKRHSQVWNYANRLDVLSEAEQKKALEEITAEERWLRELKRAIRDRLG